MSPTWGRPCSWVIRSTCSRPAVTGFAAINLATTDGNGKAYTWNNNIGTDGSVSVASVTDSINHPLPGPIQFTVSGNTLALSWPTNLGWFLQTQTNSLATGLGTNWAVVPGSGSVTSTNITINPANGSVFFRLTTPVMGWLWAGKSRRMENPIRRLRQVKFEQ